MSKPPALPTLAALNARPFNLIVSLLVVLTGVLLTSGCDFLPFPKSPGQLTQQSLQNRPGVRSVQILGSRKWSDGAIVLYTTVRDSPGRSSPVHMFGVDIQRNPTGNVAFGGGSASEKGAIMPNGALLCHGVALGNNYSIVFGRARLPDVAAVEADFANGQTSRDETRDGVYAVIEHAGTMPTNVRALDSGGQILYQSSIPATSSLSVPAAPNESVTTPLTCGP
jgi:hypothetical protein